MDNTMQLLTVAAACGVIVGMMVLAGWLVRRRPGTLNTQYYADHWQALQAKLRDKATWPLAVIEADSLLDEALKCLKYKGKTMGERLVSAQRTISDNDMVWYGHKLRNRIVHEPNVNLKERDVKEALIGFKRALKDLGAL